jgi:hypothetical protein
MQFSVTYKGSEYHAEASNFAAAQNDLENSIGRPLPNGSEIRNETTGEAYIIRWGGQEEESPSAFVQRVTNTSSAQINAFDEVLQCDLFGV